MLETSIIFIGVLIAAIFSVVAVYRDKPKEEPEDTDWFI